MNVKMYLKNNMITKKAYSSLKKKFDTNRKNKRLRYHGSFENRSSGYNKLCIILAGYKKYLMGDVFGRIENELPDDMDVCVVTSGKYDEEIAEICKENKWSYLSTKENHVGLVQNVAISLHPKAEFIFKLDEDIFITKDYFERMIGAYKRGQKGDYIPGVMAPILPINGYGYARVLNKLGLEEVFSERFGEIKIAASQNKKNTVKIETSPDIAKFFWGEGNIVPDIDAIDRQFREERLQELPCCIRFSIGAILFERELWEEMGMFEVDYSYDHMGADEVQLCEFCHIMSRPIMVSENIVVGHFSFGPQTEEMKEFYKEHPERFKMKE